MLINIRKPDEIKMKGLEKIETNSSDFNVDNYNYDYYINNEGAM